MYNPVFPVAWYDSTTLLLFHSTLTALPLPGLGVTGSVSRSPFLIFIMFLKQSFWRGKSTGALLPFKHEDFFFNPNLLLNFLISAYSFDYFGKSYSLLCLTHFNPLSVLLVLHKAASSSLFLVRDIQENYSDQLK